MHPLPQKGIKLLTYTGIYLAISTAACAAPVDNAFIEAHNAHPYNRGMSIWIDNNQSGVLAWRWQDGRLNIYELIYLYSATPTSKTCPRINISSTDTLAQGRDLQTYRVMQSDGSGASALCRYIYLAPILAIDSNTSATLLNAERYFSDIKPGSIKVVAGLRQSRAVLDPNLQAIGFTLVVDSAGTNSAAIVRLRNKFAVNQSWPLDELGKPIPPTEFMAGEGPDSFTNYWSSNTYQY